MASTPNYLRQKPLDRSASSTTRASERPRRYWGSALPQSPLRPSLLLAPPLWVVLAPRFPKLLTPALRLSTSLVLLILLGSHYPPREVP